MLLSGSMTKQHTDAQAHDNKSPFPDTGKGLILRALINKCLSGSPPVPATGRKVPGSGWLGTYSIIPLSVVFIRSWSRKSLRSL